MRCKKISFSTFFLFAIFLIVLCGAVKRIIDTDFWWHIEVGRYIYENKIVPTHDVFSYYGVENNLSWISHEWLSDLVIYLIYAAFGFGGTVLFPLIISAAILCIVLKYNWMEYKNNHLSGGVWFAVVGVSLVIFSAPRPHMISFLFFAISVYVINLYLKKETELIWILPLLSLLWVSFHGGSYIIMFVMLFLAIITNLKTFSYGRIVGDSLEVKKIKTMIKVFGVSFLTAFVNPHTYKIVLYPITNMADEVMISLIAEWQSPNFHTFLGMVTLATLVVSTVYILISDKKIKLYDLIVFGFFIVLSLRSYRFLPYLTIATSPFIVEYFPKIKTKNGYSIINTVFVVIIGLSLCMRTGYVLLNPLSMKDFPVDSVKYIKEYKPQRIFNDYNWGGYLIHELRNDNVKVFIDGRADIFSKYTMEDYAKMYFFKNGWKESFEKYNFDAVLLPSGNPLIEELLKSTNWKEVYRDGNEVFVIKK